MGVGLMKYFRYLLLLLFFIPGVSVYAATVQEHILIVEDFSIDEEELSFSGYAFISHRDNYGKSNSVGNMRSFIVAYRGDWKDEYATSACNNSQNEKKCYSEATNVVARDMFYARCIKYSGDYSKGCLKNRTSDAGSTSNYEFNSGSCADDENCIYYNVGYSVSVSLRYIVERFFGTSSFDATNDADSQIAFKLVTKIYDGNTVIKSMASDLGLYSGLCDVEGLDCYNNTNYKTGLGLYDIEFDGVSDIIEFDAEKARGKAYTNGEIKTLKLPNSSGGTNAAMFLDSEGSNKVLYKIIGSEPNYTSTAYGGTYTDTFYQVESVIINRSYKGQTPYTIVPKKSTGISLGAHNNTFVSSTFGCGGSGCSVVSGNGYENLWMVGNWGHLDAQLKIKKFKINVKPITCNDINSGKSNVTTHDGVSCDADGNVANASFYECSEFRANNNRVIEGKIYIKMESSPVCNENKYYKDSTGIFYIPVTIKAEVLVEQSGDFHFANFTPSKVKAGKGFSISNISNGISYVNNVSFVIANRFDTPNNLTFNDTPYISYVAKDYRVDSEGNCVPNADFDLYTILEDYYEDTDFNNSNSKIYFIDSDGIMKKANTLNVALRAIGNSFLENYAPVYKGGSTVSSYSNLIKIHSCDSNSNSVLCDVTEDSIGSWSTALDNSSFAYKYLRQYSNRGYGLAYSSTHTYNLPYAYVALSDMIYDGTSYKYADVVYSTTPIANSMSYNLRPVGNKYFVGLKYVYDNSSGYDFPFDLKRSNISFVDGMTWMLSGTCGVDVEDGYYTCDDPGGCDGSGGKTKLNYKYRSINVKAPFPKFNNSNYVNAATNWQDWYWTSINREINRQRLSNSYNTLDYSVTFSKYPDASKLDITEIINCSKTGANGTCSSGYGSMTNFGVTGRPEVSRFVNKYFNVKPADNKYCGLGLFSPSCDKYS